MELIFERVFKNEEKKVVEIYEIIRTSGETMFKEQGLVHWKTPYPIESIKKNCEEREVFLVKDLVTNRYIHTFQLEFNCEKTNLVDTNCIKTKEYTAVISKFATIPEASGKGVGKLSMDYIEKYCRHKGISKLFLDVYQKSEHAIQFYKNRGFIVTGVKHTKNFIVYLMEKQL